MWREGWKVGPLSLVGQFMFRRVLIPKKTAEERKRRSWKSRAIGGRPSPGAAFAMLWICFVLAGVVSSEGLSSENREQADRTRPELAPLLCDLDSDRFETRHAAASRIEALLARPELGEWLAAEFQRVLLCPQVSFEVRWRLSGWSRRLPVPPVEAVGDPSPGELDELVGQLDADSYAVRAGARRRLEWLLDNPKSICPLLVRLKEQLARKTANDVEDPLVAAWDRVRGAWLQSTGKDEGLPPVSDAQMRQWIDAVVRASGSGRDDGLKEGWRGAECELLDLLARDAYVPRVRHAIEAKLVAGVEAPAKARLEAIFEWTKPALVAEYWKGGRRLNEQHLVVGEPTLSPRAARPTHFDRIDDRVAHCVSGNSLPPGDYPVGEAFPHPHQEGAFFHLVNLPTPRRRMAYAYQVKADPAVQLAAISRRTLDRIVADRRPLSESEILMMEGLDAVEFSRFAGKYFLLVDDSSLAETGLPRLGRRPSRFGLLCVGLAQRGTKEAMPGLAEAISQGRFLPATPRAPYRLHWLAALSIAKRDAWPGAVAWLASHVQSDELLVEGQSSGPQLGATAAALLLERRRQEPSRFGLIPAAEPLPPALQVAGYRFVDEEARTKIQRWMEREGAANRVVGAPQ